MNEALNRIIDPWVIKRDQLGGKHVHVRGGYLALGILFWNHLMLVQKFNKDLQNHWVK